MEQLCDFPPLEAVEGQTQLDSMREAILASATAVLGACASQQPAVDHATIAGQLDRAGAEITPPLGATTYMPNHQRLVDQPGDGNRSLAATLTQLPGIALAPHGQVDVRGQ
jgi:hypothetical protein